MHKPQNHTPLIEFNAVTVMRGGTKALDSVSLTIGAGENVAIVGPNGSGKSTLIKVVTRECYPLARTGGGMVRILGEETWDIFKLKSMLGIVSNDLQSMCDRPIFGHEMVLSGFFGSIGLFPHMQVTERMEARTREIIEFLEISHLAAKPMTEMSTGEARRILIGRALAHKPKALILDEPTNGLDPHAARKFSNSLRKLARAGKSIILVTHHLQDIIPEITRVIMVKDGTLFRDGAKSDILIPKNLSELFKMPLEISETNGYYNLLG